MERLGFCWFSVSVCLSVLTNPMRRSVSAVFESKSRGFRLRSVRVLGIS